MQKFILNCFTLWIKRQYTKFHMYKWAGLRKNLYYIAFCVFLITALLYRFDPCVKYWINSNVALITLLTLAIAFLALGLTERFSIFVDLIVGRENYTKTAAKEYLVAKERILGSLRFWAVEPYLEEALLLTKCSYIKFVGSINLDSKFPGVLWRYNLGVKRVKERGHNNKIGIFHKEECDVLFVVIDDAVLIEKSIGEQFFGTIEHDPQMAQQYTWINTIFYSKELDGVISAETRITELLAYYLFKKYPRIDTISELIKSIGFDCLIDTKIYQHFKSEEFNSILRNWLLKVITKKVSNIEPIVFAQGEYRCHGSVPKFK